MRGRILWGAGLAALAGAGALLWVAQSDWLREQVRVAVISEAGRVTGGRVELGTFQWNWRRRTVEARGLVIHGTEPRGTAPLLSVDRVEAQLRILSFVSHTVAIESVVVERPRAHVIVAADGGTNLPKPKMTDGKAGLQPLLELRIGRFDLRSGEFAVESATVGRRNVPWSARGENLEARLDYDSAGQKYAGTLALDPLKIAGASVRVSASAAMERDRIVVSAAKLTAGDSELNLSEGSITQFAAPVFAARYQGHFSCTSGLFACPKGVAGTAAVEGQARYVSAEDYAASGRFTGAGDYQPLRNARFSGAFEARPGTVVLTGIRGAALGGSIAAEASLRDFESYTAHGSIAGFDLRRTAALRTREALPYDGRVSGGFEVQGRLGRLPDVNAKLKIEPAGGGAEARGAVAVHYQAAKSLIELGESWIELPHTRADVSGTLGVSLKVKAESQDIADLLPALALLDARPPADLAFADASFDGVVTGPLNAPRVAGRATAHNLRTGGRTFESLTGEIALASERAVVRNGVLALGRVRAQGGGTIALTNWQPVPASAIEASIELRNADLQYVLAMTGHKELPLTGMLSGSGRISGSLGRPLVASEITLSRGAIYNQPFDSITGRLQLADRNTQTLTGLFVSGPKRVNISGRFTHEGTEFPAGSLEFNLTSNTMPLNQIALVRARQPDIHGFGKFHAEGALRIFHDARHEVRFALAALSADASANSLELEGRNLGDARFVAQTNENVVTGRFESNAAKAVIRGEGSMRLTADYPTSARITFSNVGLNALAALIVKEEDARTLNFDGEAQGLAVISGPALHPEKMTATLELPRIELRPLAGSEFARAAPNFAFINEGSVKATLDGAQLRIESARFKAPQTDLLLDGAIAMTGDAPLNLRVRGDVNLMLARTLAPDLTSSGALSLNAALRGRWNSPDLSGRATLRNGEFRYADFYNGLSNANGEIAFSGTRANIQAFTAESGGGKVEATGFAALAGGSLTFRIETKGRQIRVRYPEGVSSVSDAALTFFGSPERSEVSGNITVHRVSINPRSDAGNILQSIGAPVQTPATRNGFVANMNLDVKVQTAPDVALQTSVAQSLQADAALTLRGTAASPALLGRINITQGEIVFFGNKYAINQGSVSFFNPARIDPILNIDLETKARGVDVVLTVAGPMKGLNVSYRSDPPLQFSDILALLATGRTPTDPTTSSGGSIGPAQGFQQLGASALLGQAIANPVAGRLERFFGVSRLKIDPQLTGVTGSPEARLTLEQQITPDILFTYITDVASTSTQLIRAEWSFSRNWSAILIREENGYVGLDFTYKKRFR